MWARSFWTRGRGLIGWTLPAGRGFVIERSRQIHTCFMSFPIDAVFCDRDWKVVHVVHEVAPWRFSKWVRRAHYVVELPAGKAEPVVVGDLLV